MRKEITEMHEGTEYAGEVIIELNKPDNRQINPGNYHIVDGYVDGIAVSAYKVTSDEELFDVIPVVERAVRSALRDKIEKIGKTSIREKLGNLGFIDYIAPDGEPELPTVTEGDA